jgi:O-antigen/teichoic acid export membrane protein
MVIKNSVIYLFSSILSKGIPFLLLPIMTSYLSPEEYGMLSIYMLIITFYYSIIGMNINNNISRNFFKTNKQTLAIYIGNIFYILLTVFLIYFTISYIVSLFFIDIFSIPTFWLLLIPFIALFTMINELNTTILRNEQRAYMFGVFEVSLTVLIMAVTVLCLVVFRFGWHSQIVGIFVAGVVFSIVGIAYMYKRGYITMEYDSEKVKSILNISVPLIPHVLGGLVIAASDRLFIEQMVSLEAVGLYAVGYAFGMIVMIFTDAFIKAWSPWFYKNLSNPTDSKKQKIVKYTYIFIIGIFVLAGAISIISEFILPYFVDERYHDASEFIFWISLGYAIRGVYQIFFPYLVHINRTTFLATSTVVAATVNLGLNYLLINIYGTIGAAYATVGAFTVSALLVFWYQQKRYYMPWINKVIND